MYFWRIEKLKQEMVARPLSDRQVLPYVVVFAAVCSAVTYLPRETGNGWDGIGAIWSTLLAALGTIYIYRQNGGTEGRHFLQRYFAIGWVVAIRWLIVTMLVAVAYYGVLVAAGDDLEETYWHEPVLFGLLELAVYWRIGHHVRDLVQRANVAAATPGDRMQDSTRVQPVKL